MEFEEIRQVLTSAKGRIGELNGKICKLEQELSDLVCLPLPYDDFVDWALGRYDQLADGWRSEFKTTFLVERNSSFKPYYMSKRTGHRTLEDFKAVFGAGIPVSLEKPGERWANMDFPISPKAFFFIFKDAIKAGMRRTLDECLPENWPEEVGPARAERIPMIESLEREIAELVDERDYLTAQIASVGE